MLEHKYAATLLASVLTSTAAGELGDDCAPELVRLQASDVSPVDDIVLDGRTADGGTRRVSIGVRRNPALTAGDTASVKLIRSFLRVVTDNWSEVAAGRWRVALAVAVPSKTVQEVNNLALIAQSSSSGDVFREMVARDKATNSDDRDRLAHLDALAQKAAAGEAALAAVDPQELTWRWLSALRMHLLRIEGVDQSDRTASVVSLQHLLPGGTTLQADALFGDLAELSGGWAATAARVDPRLLRRSLSGHLLLRSPTYLQAWSALDGLAGRLRDGVRPELAAEGVNLELPRAEARAQLAAAMETAGRESSALVVTGEPDVGKSAITLRVVESLQRGGAVVLALSLRDLPSPVVDVEKLLGATIRDVLGSAETGPLRLLVVDGAEGVLEGRGDLLRELAAVSMQNGIGVVAVTRSDGSARVRDVLHRATLLAGDTTVPAEHVVGRLTTAERQDLVDTFGALNRLSADARLEWLVGRPGLVDMLLRAGAIAGSADFMCEADVFAAVWNGLIRNHENPGPKGSSPDDREDTMLALARRALGEQVVAMPAGNARAELRSEGMLRAAANPALASGDELATDLIRDLALCRLFQTVGWAPLRTGGAPRWAIRAVSLACQVKLLVGDSAAAWRDLYAVFAEISSAEGRRWAEMPFDALLALGNADEMIGALRDELADDEQAGLKTLLRLAEQRYVDATLGDPFVLAHIVKATFCSDRSVGPRYWRFGGRGLGDSIRTLVLAWLRGMVRDGRGPDALRQDVRDRILAVAPASFDEFAVEALATLGPDFDAPAEQWLRRIAADDPSRLHPAVESAAAVRSLSQARPNLLIELTEAYYIESPDPEDGWGYGGGYPNDGIRDHRITAGSPGPLAAWFYGPFLMLLNTLPVDALAMVNRILDHGAEHAVSPDRGRRAWDCEPVDSDGDPAGIDLDIPPIGGRHYVGDGSVWGWYRGSTNGPNPCVSALLAVERFADHLIKINIPLADVVDLLLRDCHNMAMPGLVVGMLIRHLGAVGDLLDPWLGYPAVWYLEFSRTTSEKFNVRVQGADPDVVGRELRGLAPPNVVAEMTFRAFAAGDQARLEALATVADELLTRAREAQGGEADLDDRLVVAERWASMFSPDNYAPRRTANGAVLVQYEEPESVANVLASRAEEFALAGESARLELTYSIQSQNPDGPPTEKLLADIALARRLTIDPAAQGSLNPQDPVAAVASAAIVSHTAGRLTADVDDLRWAAGVVLEAALNPRVDDWSSASVVYPMAADRSAAQAVPALLLPVLAQLGIDESRVRESLEGLATSPFNEVRTAFVAGSAPVWAAPCTVGPTSGGCRQHKALWTAAQSGLRDCRLGPFNEQGQKTLRDELPPPYTETLPTVGEADLMVDLLAMPIANTFAARTAVCLGQEAAALLAVMLDAHRRGLDHWSAKGYSGYRDRQREPVVRVLLKLAIEGEAGPLEEHLRTFAANASALQCLLHDIAVLSTYDDDLRSALPTIWPAVLGTTLDAIDEGADLRGSRHWVDYALGYLLPTPQLRPEDRDPDGTLARARTGWLPPEALNDFSDRWIALAAGEPKAADAVAQFARTTSSAWQSSTALGWLERIIGDRYDKCANHLWFVTAWLEDLRESAHLGPESLSRLRRIVDGLVFAGDSGAVTLQRIEE